jgi:predicted lipoprotein with Yx(FWY)xxD motif
MRIPTILFGVSAAALVGCEESPPPPPAAAVVVPVQPAVVVPPTQPAVVVPVQPTVVIPTAAASLTTATKAPFGAYLVDGAGRALYVLDGTRNGSGVNRCNADCLGVWPPLMTAGPTVAAAGVNPAMVGFAAGYGGSQASYAGWPLYYFHHDTTPGDTNGQARHDQWGTWYLISPSGEAIRPVGG